MIYHRQKTSVKSRGLREIIAHVTQVKNNRLLINLNNLKEKEITICEIR